MGSPDSSFLFLYVSIVLKRSRWKSGDVISNNLTFFFQGSFEIISCTCLHSLRFALFPMVDHKKKFGCLVCMPCMSEVLVSIHRDLCDVEP